MSSRKRDGFDTPAGGWDAIDRRLRLIYGDQEPRHYGTIIGYRLGGPDPLDGISACPRLTPAPHWHFITYGFSELYEKETDDPEVSGYGFELTFRLARRPSDVEPPSWVLSFLQNLARYVFSSGNVFEAGDHLNLNGPIALEEDTRITAVAFRRDPELEPADTPNGRLEFLQIVGLTDDEFLATRAWNTGGIIELLAREEPLLVTHLDRTSTLDQKEIREAVAARTRAEGSSTAFLFNESTRWRRKKPLRSGIALTVGVITAREAAPILSGRIPFGRPFSLVSNQQAITFEKGSPTCWSIEAENELRIVLAPDQVATLSALLARGVGNNDIRGLQDSTLEVIS